MVYRLNVPFQQKDQAKACGAKWNFTEKYWYFDGEELPDGLRRWYHDPVAKKNVQADGAFADYKTVSEVNRRIEAEFSDNVYFTRILVKGEVTNFTAPYNGTYYFDIKDEYAQLRCKLWASMAEEILDFEFKAGMQVAIAGTFTYYGKNGDSSLIVTEIYDAGAGDAALKYQQLKEKLQAEGLFDIKHKKPIPKFPATIGIVTSKNGQARKDIEKIAGKRNPYVQLLLYHSNVQGVNAVKTIIAGIKALDKKKCDVIIVGRGGGSDEELIAYNDEELARVVFAAKTPIVSAVGHEGNWALIDYVSDKRVATPSEAAEETVPDVMTTIERVSLLQKSISDKAHAQLALRMQRLETLHAKLEGQNPARVLKEHLEKLAALTESLRQKIRLIYEGYHKRWAVLTAELHGRSPTAKLVNGFGYITMEDKPLSSVQDAVVGNRIDVRMHDGHILADVQDIVPITETESGGTT